MTRSHNIHTYANVRSTDQLELALEQEIEMFEHLDADINSALESGDKDRLIELKQIQLAYQQ